MSKASLKDKTVRGVGWSAVDNMTQYIVTFGVSIVLARLLTPEDYGLIGIIAIFTSICDTLINAGFTDALIRKKDTTEDDYNTAFFVNLGMSLFLYAILFFCSPLIAIFFERAELIALTRVSSLGMVVGALALVQRTRLVKRIDFKTQTKITLIASVLSGAIGIAMALLDFGVWALVAQGLSLTSIRAILFWVYNKWIPQLRFSKNSFRSLFGFSWKLMLSNLLDTGWKELYQVVVGKFYSPGSLGQYTRAQQFSKLFSTNLTKVIQRVAYPVLSEIQDDKTRMVSAYRRIIKTTMFITAVCMIFLGAISEPLLYCLIGPKWNDAAVYLPLICIAGSLYPLHAINLNMLKIQGRSDLFLGLEVVKKIIALVPLFVGAFVGIMAMLYVNIVTGIICYFLNSYYSGRFIGYGSFKQLRDIAPSYGIATIVALSVYFLKYLPVNYWIILPIQIVVGVLVFFVACYIFNLEEYKETKQLLNPLLSKIKKM